MKTKLSKGMLIKIVASRPACGQDEIQSLIGEVFPVEIVHNEETPDGRMKPNGQISVLCENHGYNGLIVLQKMEYRQAQ